MKGFILAAALAAVGALASTAQASVPSAVKVPAGNKEFLQAHAIGVQIYGCAQTTGGYAWSLAGPRADLYKHGKLVATHFAGPTWQAKDGSQVVGARVGGVNVDPTAVDWLLLAATSTTPGRFGGTTYIQRINTTGGLIPAAGDCNAGTVGTQREVPYTADYVFWKKGRDCRATRER
jgi:hypothetical protein